MFVDLAKFCEQLLCFGVAAGRFPILTRGDSFDLVPNPNSSVSEILIDLLGLALEQLQVRQASCHVKAPLAK
jgi:hypothetical protein